MTPEEFWQILMGMSALEKGWLGLTLLSLYAIRYNPVNTALFVVLAITGVVYKAIF